ncbi:MAG: FtsH protease activity modulator HflK [Oscillospiraceae bacterium]|nr:FtsH protease activity modulator HflK [Oscillospiraceae bacterium]
MNINQDGSYSSGPVRRPRPSAKLPMKTAILLVAAVLLIGLALDSFYTLKEDQYAVITTFGRPTMVSSSGLKLKLPLIQKVTKVTKTIQGFPLGYRIGSSQSVDDESLMITYDYNFVNVDFYVEYRVTDPIKYLYSSREPVDILKMLCQSYIRDTIGLYNVDAVITTGKSEIQAAIKEKVIARLDREDIGIQLQNITIQDAEPPTAEVQRAFTAVETAKQSADTMVNNAKKYANEVIPAAAADADQIIKSAEAYRQSKINEAEGQAARFAALFEEYQKYPLITKQRLFYEAMEKVLPDMKLYIVDAQTGVQTALPLAPFADLNPGGGNAA